MRSSRFFLADRMSANQRVEGTFRVLVGFGGFRRKAYRQLFLCVLCVLCGLKFFGGASPPPRRLEKTFGRQQAGSLLGKFFQVKLRGENLF